MCTYLFFRHRFLPLGFCPIVDLSLLLPPVSCPFVRFCILCRITALLKMYPSITILPVQNLGLLVLHCPYTTHRFLSCLRAISWPAAVSCTPFLVMYFYPEPLLVLSPYHTLYICSIIHATTCSVTVLYHTHSLQGLLLYPTRKIIFCFESCATSFLFLYPIHPESYRPSTVLLLYRTVYISCCTTAVS